MLNITLTSIYGFTSLKKKSLIEIDNLIIFIPFPDIC